MSDIPFFMTAMGRRHYEHTMPELVRQLARLNDNLERLAARMPAPETEATTEANDDEAPHDREV